LITSAFPAHKVLGHISKLAQTEIEVSRHTGAAPLAASGATTDFQPPCAYEGTSKLTFVSRWVGGAETVVLAATGLRFELDDIQLDPARPPVAHYRVVAGDVTWTASGGDGCGVFTGSGSFSAVGDPKGSGAPANLYLSDDGGIQDPVGPGIHYSFFTVAPTLLGSNTHCDGYVFEWPFYPGTWLEGRGRFQPGDATLRGTFHSERSGDVRDTEWDLHAAECQPSPEPVCQ